jgi:NADH dehydrogenase [ubiquinone] 1 alpha subcomplex assembly factor 3
MLCVSRHAGAAAARAAAAAGARRAAAGRRGAAAAAAKGDAAGAGGGGEDGARGAARVDKENTARARARLGGRDEAGLDSFLGGRGRSPSAQLTGDDGKPRDMTDSEVASVQQILHPDHKQNKLDQYAFAIEMSEQVRSQMSSRVQVRGMGQGGFFVNNHFARGSICVLNDVLLSWSAPRSAAELTEEHFRLGALLNPGLDLLVIGTGQYTQSLSPDLMKALRRIAPVEVCSTFHACSTFNLMNMEDRRVMALLFAV